jgi:hypothetical protein
MVAALRNSLHRDLETLCGQGRHADRANDSAVALIKPAVCFDQCGFCLVDDAFDFAGGEADDTSRIVGEIPDLPLAAPCDPDS